MLTDPLTPRRITLALAFVVIGIAACGRGRGEPQAEPTVVPSTACDPTPRKLPHVGSSGSPAALFQDGRIALVTDQFVLLSAEGKALSSPRDLESTGSASDPAVAWDGEQYGVVYEWRRDTTAHELRLARFNAQGERIGEPTTLASTSGSADPAIAWTGRAFAIVWAVAAVPAQRENLMFALVTDQDMLAEVQPVGSGYYPSIAAVADRIAVVWYDPARLIHVAFHDREGIPSGEVTLPGNVGDSRAPAAVVAGPDLAVLWHSVDLHVVVLDANGNILEQTDHPDAVEGPFEPLRPVATWDGRSLGAVYRNSREHRPSAVYYVELAGPGTAAARTQLSSDGESADDPVSVYTGTEHVVIWRGWAEAGQSLMWLRRLCR